MKKDKKDNDEMRPEYKRSDFGKLERGKYFREVAKGTSVVLLEPDVAKAFPNSAAVNEALQGLLALAKKSVRSSRAPRQRTRKPAA